MDFHDISLIQDQLFALSCLEDSLHEKLLQEWNNRFSVSTALLTRVDQQEDAFAIRNKVIEGINGHDYHLLPGSNVCAAVFLDLTQELTLEKLNVIYDTIAWLETRLNVTNQIVSYFGFVGTAGVFTKTQLQKNIELVQASVRNHHKLWLVAEPILKSQLSNFWKPSLLFLDLLRRDSQQTGNFSSQTDYADGCVGFFRYGEYKEEALQHVKKEIAVRERWLGDDGDFAFARQIEGLFKQQEEEVRRDFAAEASLQPTHPDMYPVGFWKIRKAKKGRNRVFEQARRQTEAAVNTTAENLIHQITEFYKGKIGDPKGCIVKQLTAADVSIGFVVNKSAATSKLREFQGESMIPTLEPLSYSKEGCTDRIGRYLEAALNYAITTAQNTAATELIDAYARLSVAEIEKKKTELSGELSKLRGELELLSEMETFCYNVINPMNGGRGMTKDFNPIMQTAGDRTTVFLACRRAEDWDWIQTVQLPYEAAVRYISDQCGGIVQPDKAPVKGLYAVYFACTAERLEDLLR